MGKLVDKIHAQTVDWNFFMTTGDRDLNRSSGDLNMLITNIISVILYIAGVVAVIYLIYSGILYLTAAGNPDAAKKGQQGIINAVIGIVIIVLVWVIARSVAGFAETIAN